MGFPMYFNSNTFFALHSVLLSQTIQMTSLINHIFPHYSKIVMFFLINIYWWYLRMWKSLKAFSTQNYLKNEKKFLGHTHGHQVLSSESVYVCIFLWHCQNLLQDGIKSENKTHYLGFWILLQYSQVVIDGQTVQVRFASVDMKIDVWVSWLIAHLNRQHNNDYIFGAWCSYDLFNCLT